MSYSGGFILSKFSKFLFGEKPKDEKVYKLKCVAKSCEVLVDADIEEMWKGVGNFGDCSWLAPDMKTVVSHMYTSAGEYIKYRTMSCGGKVIKERFVASDDHNHSNTFSFFENEGKPADGMGTLYLDLIVENGKIVTRCRCVLNGVFRNITESDLKKQQTMLQGSVKHVSESLIALAKKCKPNPKLGTTKIGYRNVLSHEIFPNITSDQIE